jgi:hypothetical protein
MSITDSDSDHYIIYDYDAWLKEQWALDRERCAREERAYKEAVARQLRVKSAALASNPNYVFNQEFDKELQDLGAMVQQLSIIENKDIEVTKIIEKNRRIAKARAADEAGLNMAKKVFGDPDYEISPIVT